MRKPNSTKKITPPSWRFRLRLIWILTLAALLFFAFGIFLSFALSSHADTSASLSKSVQTPTSTPVEDTQQSTATTPVTNQNLSSNQTRTQKHSSSPVSTAAATPTLVPSTPQPTRFGVFPLSSGGPLPVPQRILHPTNIARVMLHNTLISVYAGSMTQNPQVGILCVLQEDLTTGQLNLQMYQSSHPEGPLTILAVQNTTLKLVDPKGQGSFDLSTNQFQW